MVGFAPPSERMGLVDQLMTMGFLEPWRRALVACCPTNVSPNPVGYTGVAMVENKLADRPYQSLDGGDEADMCLKIAHLVRDGCLMREVAQNIKLTLNL